MEKTYIKFLNDSQYGDYKAGEFGYFLSAVFNGERPFIVVANTDRKAIVLCMAYEVEIIEKE